MLSLTLFRHAKSSWDDPSLDDFDRCLNERGRRAAPVMGKAIAELGISPDLVLCSTAKRARETFDLAAPGFDCKGAKVLFEDALYLPSAEELLARIRAVPVGPRTILLIGHNPGLHGLALKLVGSGDSKSLSRLEDKFPTGTVAVFNFPQSSWAAIEPGTGRLESFVAPRDRG